MSDASQPAPPRGAEPAASPRGAESAASPRLLARIGLAVVSPRWALALASDRRVAGRSGTDLIALIAIVVAATQLRGLVSAIWLGAAIDPGLGFGAAMRLFTQSLVSELLFLVVGALALWLAAGPRRNLGRTFDLACVAVIPLFLVSLAASVAALAQGAPLPAPALWIATGVAWAWSGALLALAWRPARLGSPATPAPPHAVVRPARLAALAIAALALAGAALGVVWIARNLDLLRPVEADHPAPLFALPSIGPGGAPGPAVAPSQGRVAVVDFWATWCDPCILAMPKLEALAAEHPDLDVIAVTLDDTAAARVLFDRRGWTHIRLAADDGVVSQRYNVSTIPHTVVIDREGVVRHIFRGVSQRLSPAVAELLRK